MAHSISRSSVTLSTSPYHAPGTVLRASSRSTPNAGPSFWSGATRPARINGGTFLQTTDVLGQYALRAVSGRATGSIGAPAWQKALTGSWPPFPPSAGARSKRGRQNWRRSRICGYRCQASDCCPATVPVTTRVSGALGGQEPRGGGTGSPSCGQALATRPCPWGHGSRPGTTWGSRWKPAFRDPART